jgi:hypothetical protein
MVDDSLRITLWCLAITIDVSSDLAAAPSNRIACRRGSNEDSTRNAPPFAARSSFIA